VLRRSLSPGAGAFHDAHLLPAASLGFRALPFRAYYAPKASAGTTTMDIGRWLRGLGLERYEQVFRDNVY
jgi:hypothetical protein